MFHKLFILSKDICAVSGLCIFHALVWGCPGWLASMGVGSGREGVGGGEAEAALGKEDG